MHKGRLEAFSDGVIAIILTIMVLELKVPHEPTLAALRPLAPVFLSYVISFIVIGIYWNNHHHLFQAVQYINGRVMWANLHLLFWLSLVPFVTAWTGENNFVAVPVALHGAVFLLVRIMGKKPEHTHIVIQEIAEENWGFMGMLTDDWKKQQI
jgi:uncharacterized membrane protein